MSSATTQLPKTYDPHSIEHQALRVWNDEKLFHAEPTDPGKPFAIVIPPPNVTAPLHLGHALNNTLQDILVRWHRMLGDNAIWLPGTDHAGIATQTVVEKRVLAEQGKRRTEFQRDEFVAIIQAWKDEYEQTITNQLKMMGCSCDWERQAFTMDPIRARAVREAFFRLFKDGLIYRGKRLVNWDPATQTALADDEVEMEEVDGHFYYLKYPLVEEEAQRHEGTKAQSEGEGSKAASERTSSLDSSSLTSCLRASVPSSLPQYVTVATTRPETMLGDTAVAINPRDPRAAALRGKHVRLPIVNRIVPIIEDDYVVLADPNSDDPKAKYATGFLKVTPAHDPNDYDIGLRHKLPMINVLAPDGTISDQHGWPAEDVARGGEDLQNLLGLDRFEARQAVVEWFRKNKLLEDVKPYRHSVGHSYRSHVPIEPYLSDQWYCKVTDDRLAGAALRAMAALTPSPRTLGEGGGEGSGGGSDALSPTLSQSTGRGSEGQLRFYPPRYSKTFQTWHENLRDWCISRQLWWGHRIPVWRQVRLSLKPHPTEGVQGWWQHEANVRRDEIALAPDPAAPNGFFVCLREHDKDLERILEKDGFVQDPDVLDTWFSSGLWPLSTLGWAEDTPELRTWNPTSVLCTAREIITLWVSRMVMFNLYLRGTLPFYDVFIHAMIQDGEGRKMSKSLGNGVDPLDIISSHGADALRFTLTLMTTNTQDVRMPVEKDPASGKNTSPKFDIGRNFCNKLWNAVRFAMMNLEGAPSETPDEAKWTMWDRWILSRLNHTIKTVDEALASYNFDEYGKACYDFFWRDLCDWYIEAIKPAMRDPQRAGQTACVLSAAIDGALRLMHPMIPFITETLFWKLNEVRPNRTIDGVIELDPAARLIKAPWPRRVNDWTAMSADFLIPKMQELIEAIRRVRNEHKVETKKPVTVSIRASGDACRTIENNREVIELLAIAKLKQVAADLAEVSGAAKTQAAGCDVYIEGIVDEAAEQQRTAKRREQLTREIDQMRKRLSNEGYIAKAPPHLVQQTKDQLAAAETELKKLGG